MKKKQYLCTRKKLATMCHNNLQNLVNTISSVFKQLFAKVKSQKLTAFCVCIFLLSLLLIFLFSSCSSVQRITVKQEQDNQLQETVIESDTKINSLSLLFVSPSNLSKL